MKKIIITIISTVIILSGIFLSDYIINNNFVDVRTIAVVKKEVTGYIKAEGISKEQNKRVVMAELPYVVEEIYVSEGDSVNKGEKLFKISKNEFKNQIEMKMIENNNDAYENIIARIENSSDYFTTPINGIVTKINIKEGETVKIDTPAIVISDLDNQIIKSKVPETLIKEIYVGQKVKIEGVTFNGEETGKVTKIYPVGETSPYDLKQSFVMVDVMADNYNNIKPETTLNLSYEKRSNKEKILIPFDSIMFDEEKPYVFLDKYGYAVKRYVNIGDEYEIDAEITEGLNSGEEIIENPKAITINQGQKINVLNKGR